MFLKNPYFKRPSYPRLNPLPFLATVICFLACSVFLKADGNINRESETQVTDRTMTHQEILRIMEKVADWQLNHPCNIEICWQSKDKQEEGLMRMSWNGTILLKRKSSLSAEANLPAAWKHMIKLEHGNMALNDLPEAVQKAWENESGNDGSTITRIKLVSDSGSLDWEMAALYHGLLAISKLSDKPVYRHALSELAKANSWNLGKRLYHADDHAVGYMYLDFYQNEKRPEMLAGVQSRFDWILKHPSVQSMDIKKGQDRWTWCDALFMAAPVWTRLYILTGDERYLDFMNREWQATSDYLYSGQDRLFYRDSTYFGRQEKNGEKIFWSRGNAWVVSALTLIIEDIPEYLPERKRYIQQFQEMMQKIVSLQPNDKLWRASLLDPEHYTDPEASASAFFCYAVAWGVNHGFLDAKTYKPVAWETWIALQNCIDIDGYLGYIQQPGAAPGSSKRESTAPYGIGAFLLAGSEMYDLIEQ